LSSHFFSNNLYGVHAVSKRSTKKSISAIAAATKKRVYLNVGVVRNSKLGSRIVNFSIRSKEGGFRGLHAVHVGPTRWQSHHLHHTVDRTIKIGFLKDAKHVCFSFNSVCELNLSKKDGTQLLDILDILANTVGVDIAVVLITSTKLRGRRRLYKENVSIHQEERRSHQIDIHILQNV
jgi:hypothetical protein